MPAKEARHLGEWAMGPARGEGRGGSVSVGHSRAPWSDRETGRNTGIQFCWRLMKLPFVCARGWLNA